MFTLYGSAQHQMQLADAWACTWVDVSDTRINSRQFPSWHSCAFPINGRGGLGGEGNLNTDFKVFKLLKRKKNEWNGILKKQTSERK